MMKNRKIILNILVSAVIMIGAISTTSLGFSAGGHTFNTNADLAAYAEEHPTSFMKIDAEDLYKKTITVGGGKAHGRASDINFKTAGCLYHREGDIEGTKNVIKGVVDIDARDNDLKVEINGNKFKFSSNSTTEYNQKKAVTSIAYALWNAQENSSTDKESVQKNAIRYIWFYGPNDNGKGFSWFLKNYTKISKEFWTKSINGANDSGSRKKAVDAAEDNSYFPLKKTDNGKQKVITASDGKQYIGPFKVRYSGYKEVKNLTLTVDGKKYNLPEEYYTKEGSEFKKHKIENDKIVKNKSFYIKVDDSVNIKEGEEHSWKVTLKTSKRYGYKARLLLISNPNASGQNLLIWGATREDKDADEVEWTGKDKSKPADNTYSLTLVKENLQGDRINKTVVFSVNGETKTASNGRITVAKDIKITKENVNNTDTYTIIETQAPTGYDKIETPIIVTVTKKLDGKNYVVDKVTVSGGDGLASYDSSGSSITLHIKNSGGGGGEDDSQESAKVDIIKIDEDESKGTQPLPGFGFRFKTQIKVYEWYNYEDVYEDEDLGHPDSETGAWIPNWQPVYQYTKNYYHWVTYTAYLQDNGQWLLKSDSYPSTQRDTLGNTYSYSQWTFPGESSVFITGSDGKIDQNGVLPIYTQVVNDANSPAASRLTKYNNRISETRYAKFTDDEIIATEVEDKIPKNNADSNNPELYGYYNIANRTKGDISITKDEENTITNKQDVVMISGFVWEDSNSGKVSVGDSVYKESDGEKGLHGVKVSLKDSNGNLVTLKDDVNSSSNFLQNPTYTDEYGLYDIENGEYKFIGVPLDQIDDLHVEFEYDGLEYESVPIDDSMISVEAEKSENTEEANNYKISSKAAEISDERNTLNNKFYKIEGNGTEDITTQSSDGTPGIELHYNGVADHKSTIDKSRTQKYPLHSTTDEAGFSLEEHFTPSQKEIKYVNLGLHKRVQTDYALEKDLDSVKIQVNGRQHVYKYGTRNNNVQGLYDTAYPNDGDYSSVTNTNVGVKFEKSNGRWGAYQRPVYNSDAYNANGNEQELQIYLIYKITLKNESPYLGRIYSIIDYSDPRLNRISIGSYDANNYDVTNEISNVKTTKENGYKKEIIEVDKDIQMGQQETIYIKYQVGNEGVANLLSGDVLINNIAEINAYTTIGDDNNYLAVYDQDSVPSNTKTNSNNINQPEVDTDSMEDDSDGAPTFKLGLVRARQISGTVFIDKDAAGKATGQIVENTERVGNMFYDNGEPEVKGIKVELIDLTTGQTAKLYETNPAQNNGNNNPTAAEYTTGQDSSKPDGYFEFNGFLPGRYKIQYTWGGQTYTLDNTQYRITVQNYKGTVYDSERTGVSSKLSLNQNLSGVSDYAGYQEFWYKGSGYRDASNTVHDYDKAPYTLDSSASDALDDYNERMAIDNEMTKYINQDMMNNYISNTNNNNSAYKNNIETTTGLNTLQERINACYDGTGSGFTTSMHSSTPDMEVSVEYDTIETDGTNDNLNNRDQIRFTIAKANFGIVERPLQRMNIDKKLDSYKLVLANGQVLVDVKFDENGDMIGDTKQYTTVMPKVSGQDINYRTVKTEMDNELIEGATIELTYKITVKNTGEKDYMSKEYYLYGTNKNDPVKLKPTQILDYVNGNVNLGQLANGNNKIEKNGTQQNVTTTWEAVPDTYTEYFNASKWQETNVAALSNDAKAYLNKIKPYITRSLENTALAPTETGTVYIKTSKLLTSTDDNQFDNLAETTEIQKQDPITPNHTGSPVVVTTTTDGIKYFNQHSPQTVEILPSTGANKNYVMPITIAISAIAVLGVGIFLIKKYVIGRKK